MPWFRFIRFLFILLGIVLPELLFTAPDMVTAAFQPPAPHRRLPNVHSQITTFSKNPRALALNSLPGVLSANCEPTWKTLSSPNVADWPNSTLSDVKAISTNDVWAVGIYWGSAEPPTLTMHWDGEKWRIIPSPSPGLFKSELVAIDGTASDDLWAVGYTEELNDETHTLALHWDGTAWQTIPSPNPYAVDNWLTDVVAVAPDNVWAVGWGRDGITDTDFTQPLFLHWDGADWTPVSAPQIENADHHLAAIDANGANDIYAVGNYSYYDENLDDEFVLTLILHYDGANWTIISSPNPATHSNGLAAVETIAANDVWAVGAYTPQNSNSPRTLTLHWDGASWNVIASPNPAPNSNTLVGIKAFGSSELYTVGTIFYPTQVQSLALRGNGNAWHQETTPITNEVGHYLSGIDGVAASDLWAVGRRYNPGKFRTLVLHRAPPIARAALELPVNNAVIFSNKTVLDWKESTCASFYMLDVRRDSKTGSQVIFRDNLDTTRVKLRHLAKANYFWRVRACNADACAAWSKWRSFKKG